MNSPTPLLSLCMIVRNSARTLPACLASIRPWVDEIVVVDTGSLDETRDIARRFGARVSEFTWIDDFSAARNESLRHAQGEWLFWMDSDDTINEVNGRELRSLVEGPHAADVLGYVMQVHCPSSPECGEEGTTVVDHVKLTRNDSRIRFEGRIHEQVLPSIRRLGGNVAWTDLFVVHSGADYSPEGEQRKVERDLRILQLDLTERPDHPFVIFNLGMTYADMGQHSTAEEWLRKCLALSHSGESHLRKAYALLVASLQQQHQLAEAWQVCLQGLAIFPTDPELHFRRGMLAHERKQFDEAIAAYRAVLFASGSRHFASIDRGISGYKTRHNLALLLVDLGRLPLAELQLRLGVSEAPYHRPSVRALGQLLLDQRKLTAAEMLADQVLVSEGTVTDALWIQSEVARLQGDSQRARELLERTRENEPDSLFVLRARCRFYFDMGSLDEAAAALEDLAQREPDNASVHHNRGQIYVQQGDRGKAIAAFERSLQLRPNWQPTMAQLLTIQAPPGDIGHEIVTNCGIATAPA